MTVRTRIASTFATSALALLISRSATAQTNPGQFGGAAPGQFDPNAQPGAQPGSGAPPGQFDPGAQPSNPGQFNPNAQPGGAPPGQFDPNAQPGGAPPSSPTFSGPTDPNDPNARLDAAKEEDSGRGLTWFWLELGGGFEHGGIQTIDDGDAFQELCARPDTNCDEDVASGTRSVPASGTGGMIEAGLGARLLFFTLGARGRLSFLDRYSMARVGPEAGLRIPIGSIEPRFALGGGYATVLDYDSIGYYVRLSGGLDWFVSSNFALGADLSGDLFGIDSNTDLSSATSDVVTVGPDGIGLGIALGLHVGLHL